MSIQHTFGPVVINPGGTDDGTRHDKSAAVNAEFLAAINTRSVQHDHL